MSRQIFSLDTFGRQADKYITRGVMFFMFFYVFYLCIFARLPITAVISEILSISVTVTLF